MEKYFEDVCMVLDKLALNRTKKFKMNFKAKLYMSVLMNNYRQEIIAQRPPAGIIKIMGWIANLMGISYSKK